MNSNFCSFQENVEETVYRKPYFHRVPSIIAVLGEQVLLWNVHRQSQKGQTEHNREVGPNSSFFQV